MWSDSFLWPRLGAGAAICLALVACPVPSRGDVSVRGTAAAVRIDAKQAPLSEVLSALGANFELRYDTLIALDEVIVSGTYAGALEEVLKRILTGLNYVIQTQEGAVEVIVVGRRGDPPAAGGAGAPAPPPQNTNPASQWRKSAQPAQGR